jgi:hypothetical protein
MNKNQLKQIYQSLLDFYETHEKIPLSIFSREVGLPEGDAQPLLDSLKGTILQPAPAKKRKYKKRRAKAPARITPKADPIPKPTPKKKDKVSLYSIIRLISNVIIILLNSGITVYLFVNFGSNKYLKGFWAAFGLVIMFMQVYSLKRFKGCHGGIKKTQFLIAYILSTFFSMTGNLGFTLSEIAHGRKTITVIATKVGNTQEDISYYKTKIEGFNRDIEVLRKENENEKTPAWKRSVNDKRLKELQNDLGKAEAEWKEARSKNEVVIKEDAEKVETKNSLDYMAEALTIIPIFSTLTGEALRSFLMLLLSFVFEYFLYFTTSGMKEEEE